MPNVRPFRLTLGLASLLIAAACQAPSTKAPSHVSLAQFVSPIPVPSYPHRPPVLARLDWMPQPSYTADWSELPGDLLDQVAMAFELPQPEHALIDRERDWYASHPEYLTRVFTRAQRYLPHVAAELERRGMPADLSLLPVVESAYDPFAYSHGRAAGLWQFIPGTGRRYGLKQTWWYDGRRDVVESTRAALDYLQDLHDRFEGDWLNAVAAYNSGEGHVARAIARNKKAGKPTDFFSIRKMLPKETRTYVPKLLAITQIVSQPHRFNVQLPPVVDKPFFASVDTNGQIDMALAAELAGVDTDELYALNPGINRWATDPAGPHRLLVPVDAKDAFAQRLDELGERDRVKWTRHRIRNGETLGQLARRFRTTTAVLREVNNLRGNMIRSGQYLMIPHATRSMKSYTQTADARAARTQARQRKGTKTTHEVRAGESFWSIAQRYGVGVRNLAAWNAMAPRDTLSVGHKLVVWRQDAPVTATQPTNGRIRRVTYTVRRGDSLARISQKFRVTVGQLLKWNKISAEKYLQPGQRLVMYVDVTRQSS